MSSVDALRLVETTRNRLVDLAISENYLRDPDLTKACAEIWRGPAGRGGLVSELWVQGAFPGKLSTDSLGSLAAAGLFPPKLCEHLDGTNNFPADRYLFDHQSQALKAFRDPIGSKPSLVITAGTGAGKTESFLFPILSRLWDEPRSNERKGMRCLILYPMNALVTDQVTRLYELLRGQSNPSIFHFTSETPENTGQANRVGEPNWDSCRRRTREEARDNVPDIVITNYSMLEYMLCRPQDAVFFGPGLEYIVLDEAHLYTGALAAEITLLLRRVRDRCGVPASAVSHIATSATLGGTVAELRKFASVLFSVEEPAVQVIEGQQAELRFDTVSSEPRQPLVPEPLAKRWDLEIATLTPDGEFADPDHGLIASLNNVASLLVGEDVISDANQHAGGYAARFLKLSLDQAPAVRKLASIIHSRQFLSLDELTRELWSTTSDDAREATIVMLRLAAAARCNAKDAALVPHRLHFLVRAPEGLSVCLNPLCSGPKALTAPGVGCFQAPQDRCRHCEAITLPVHRCATCGEWALAGHENVERGQLEPGHFVKVQARTYYLLTRSKDEDLAAIVVNPTTGDYFGVGAPGTVLFKAPCPEHGAACNDPARCVKQACPSCHVSWSVGPPDTDADETELGIHPLRGAERVAVSVVAETVLFGLPTFPDQSRQWKPAGGRRLLCFSDSRREAARLGPLLTAQHQTWVVRSAIASAAMTIQPPSQPYIERQIARCQDDLNDSQLSSGDREEAKRKLVDLRRQLGRATLGVPVAEFARSFANEDRLAEVLDQELGERLRLPPGVTQTVKTQLTVR